MNLSRAISILRDGGLVAFPTETVYGLGADATNAAAVRRIFAAKGRPPTNPLIVHVADEKIARRYAGNWPQAAARLAAKFWPGPLTLVVPRAVSLAPEVSAGRDTVGLRAPDHPLALQLLREFDGPIAAPSANRSTRISPTRAEHVREELGDAVDLILDGGPCRVGIESTVLDLSGDAPVILRQGAIMQNQIEAEIGPVKLFAGSVDPAIAAASPGQHAIHYAPRARAYRFDSTSRPALAQMLETNRARSADSRALVYLESSTAAPAILAAVTFAAVVQMPADSTAYAQRIYQALREVDQPGVDTIFVEMPPDEPAWAAVRDRLSRATTPLP
ncbi:MAG TPA: L-threonylcarbamoyladenylate synthase [Tepidisphaeraceae bacterium]|jgi:L-threonylcarbamoyladenylate synthase|nr:L-threonylcarbamoyladenylate synthase [Tepidisphaeraceae bacterium]